MKAFVIANKMLRESLRDLQLLGIYLAFPVLMVVIYYYAFGSTAKPLASTLILLIDNQDRGAAGSELVKELRTLQYESSPVFSVVETHDRDGARISLLERKASLLLTIPPDFSQVLGAALKASPPRLRILADPLSDTANFSTSFLEPALRNFVSARTGWKQTPPSRYEFVAGTGKLSDFQAGVPGVVVFGIMFGIVYTAIVVIREVTSGALQRLRLSGMSTWDMVAGVTLSQLVLCLVQVSLTLLAAIAFGMQNNGSYLLLGTIAVLLSLSATGCGFVCACLGRNDGEAASLATVFLFPLVFISGALFPMPIVPLITIAGRTVALNDLLPTAPAADALRRVLFYGETTREISYHLLVIMLSSLVLFAIGAWLFHKIRLRRSM